MLICSINFGYSDMGSPRHLHRRLYDRLSHRHQTEFMNEVIEVDG